jgi:tripartite-type tricarboxylate transporter receptor subunit TctC
MTLALIQSAGMDAGADKRISAALSLVIIGGISAGITLPGVGVARGQDYPNRPIQMITSEPGGGNDFAARLIAQGLSSNFAQQVIVTNRGAAGGVIAAETVAKAPPDGYALLFYGSNIWLLPFLRSKVPYDPVRDFSPVTLAVRAPIILVTHPSIPAASVEELIALAKASPGRLNYGSGATGSASQIATELFKSMAGVDIAKISYKGNGPALNALIAGEVQLAFATPGSVASHIKSGRLKALAVTSARPSALVPGLPTVAASGLPGYEAASIVGVFAPAKTPPALINRINREFVRVINRADVTEKFFNVGVETVGSSPEEFAATVKSEMARLGAVIRNAGIHDE